MVTKKRLLLFMGMLLSFGQMRAAGEVTFSMESFSIKPGETVEVSLNMTNTVNVQIFNGEVQMTEGLSFVKAYDEFEEAEVYVFRTDRLHNKHDVGTNLLSANSLTFIVQSGTTRRDVTGNAGAVLKFKVKADENFSSESAQITFKELSATNADNKELCAVTEFTTDVNVYNIIIKDDLNESYLVKEDGSLELAEAKTDESGNVVIPATVDGKAVTSIGANAFANVDKTKLTVIDLSGTAVTDVTVNRSEGAFNGVSESTLIYLPSGTGNQAATGEKNVIIGGVCEELVISENQDFEAPKAFTVKHAVFGRVFNPGVTATVYLPFSIPASEAGKLGAFHTFKQISDEGTAVFNSAETGEIQALVPYIFIPTKNKIDVTDASGNIHVAVSGSTDGKNGQLIGTTSSIVWDEGNPPTNIYGFAGETRGDVGVGTFVKAKTGASIDAYRAYLVIGSANARGSFIAVIDGGESTAIKDVKDSSCQDGDVWHSMTGLKLTSAPDRKGLYIKNGKKTIIK